MFRIARKFAGVGAKNASGWFSQLAPAPPLLAHCWTHDNNIPIENPGNPGKIVDLGSRGSGGPF